VVVPLVFFSLVVGIASLGDIRKLGRMGGRTLGFFMLTTIIALVIGVGLANIVKPGKMVSPEDSAILLSSFQADASSKVANAAEAPSFADQIISIVPTNPLAALVQGNMLQVIFFAVMLGIALTFMGEERAKLVVDGFDRLNDAMVMLVHIAMKIAPFGVGALLFKVVGNTGVSVLIALGVYGLVVLAGLLIHLVFTYGTVVKLVAKLPFLQFLDAIKEAMLVAFSTSSSSATLPVTKGCCEDNLGCSPETTSFVLPLGATVNMDGTALYQGVAAIFIAQVYGMDLDFGQQVTIVISATLASVGAAGVPGAGMITLAMVLTSIGVPTEGLALILGVDRLLDMFRTATNVVGDSTATVLMARLEGENLRFMSDSDDAADPSKGFEGRLDHGTSPVGPDKPR
jgi:Na+/H+-dicarboxylate symporter